MSTEISAAHEHIELSHNLDIRFDLFQISTLCPTGTMHLRLILFWTALLR